MKKKKVEKKIVVKRPKPRVAKTEIEEISNDLGVAISFKTLHDSEGGQLLIDGLVKDILGAIETLCSPGVLELPGYIMIAARIKERMDILEILTGAKSRKEVLEDILKERLEEEKQNPPTPQTTP